MKIKIETTDPFLADKESAHEMEKARRKNAGLRILVVDDFLTMRATTRSLLKELGCVNVDEAHDGQAAWQKVCAMRYDLVITDNNMPKMHGITLIEKIRSREETKNLAVVMITAEKTKDVVLHAGRLELSDFILKPYSPAIFAKRIGAVLGNLASRKVLVEQAPAVQAAQPADPADSAADAQEAVQEDEQAAQAA